VWLLASTICTSQSKFPSNSSRWSVPPCPCFPTKKASVFAMVSQVVRAQARTPLSWSHSSLHTGLSELSLVKHPQSWEICLHGGTRRCLWTSFLSPPYSIKTYLATENNKHLLTVLKVRIPVSLKWKQSVGRAKLPQESLWENTSPASSSFWWLWALLGFWPYPSNLYLCGHIASYSSLCISDLCATLMRLFVTTFRAHIDKLLMSK
jgi:hypothetical protein